MARLRESAKILALKGAFKTHPERDRRKLIPQCKKPLQKRPPKDLAPKVQEVWKKMRKMIPEGIVFDSDIFLINIAARLQYEYDKYGDEFPSAKLSRLLVCLDKLGLSPHGREGLKVEKKKEENKEDEFI